MAKATRAAAAEPQDDVDGPGADGEDVVLEGTLVCSLTQEHRTATPQEETLQSFIEQLHREYGVPLADMGRDVRVECALGEDGGRQKTKTRTVQLVVYEHGKAREPGNIIRAVLVAKPGTKPDAKAMGVLDEVLGSIAVQQERVFGLWTNGIDLTFRMREYQRRTGLPIFTELTDFPAPDETFEDLNHRA